jgi:probable HAF family extracellular repeat protein
VRGVSTSGKLVGNALSRHTGSYFNFSFAQGKYQKLVIPNASGAAVMGISPAGNALVGAYALSSEITAGFVYQNKALQTLQFPGSNITVANGINNAGEVVGYFYDSNGNTHGFSWTPPAGAAK